MSNVRAAFRLLGFAIFTGGMVLLFSLGLPFCAGKRQCRVRWKNRLMRGWAKTIAQLIGLKMDIRGRKPTPPFFLVSNHLSYLDILPFWFALKTTFVAKSEINQWPFIGLAADLLGIIFLNRDRNRDLWRVNNLIEQNISEQQGVILFPEGTSSKGRRILPFKSSLLFYPASRDLPVHYATISYEVLDSGNHRVWQEVCWWGDMDFMSHFWNFLKIKSSIVHVRFGDIPEKNKNRKELAFTLQKKANNIFEPTFKK